jgi:hypothetical protein
MLKGLVCDVVAIYVWLFEFSYAPEKTAYTTMLIVYFFCLLFLFNLASFLSSSFLKLVSFLMFLKI